MTAEGFHVPTCACCGHKQGEHKSGRSSWPHPMVYGICLVEGCACREFTESKAISGAVTAWEAEGARVGLAVCQVCGAAILLDPREVFDPLALHRQWHESPEAA